VVGFSLWVCRLLAAASSLKSLMLISRDEVCQGNSFDKTERRYLVPKVGQFGKNIDSIRTHIRGLSPQICLSLSVAKDA
jgi:hypothetical protein